MAISWQTAQSLLLFFGPWLVPRALTWYRSIRNRPASSIKPLPTQTSYALSLLFLSSLTAFLSTLPIFHPENIFRLTQSRLHTTGGVLLTRLATIRPLTSQDELLRASFDEGALYSRLFYALYGPDVLINNPLSKAGDIDSARSFLIYALPSILAPHLLHLFALGIVTSTTLSGKDGSSWRTLAIASGLILAVAEVYYVATYDSTANLRSVRVNDIDFPYWKLLVYRGLAIAGTDGVLGWMIWLQATGRAFFAPKSTGERILDHAVALEKLMVRTRGVGVIRNAAVRDGDMRRVVDDYWIKEGEVMKDVLEEPEVLEAQRNALRRVDTVRIGRDADNFVDTILPIANAAAS